MAAHQVLEFTLNDEHYCTDIEHVSEIVRRPEDDVTSVPNTPRHIEGVMDLRGETTKIVDPRRVFSLDATAEGDHNKVIVFDNESLPDENIGWAVNEVTRVSTIDAENVEQTDEETIKGIINRDEGFLIWAEVSATD